jgi:hypothetical protein
MYFPIVDDNNGLEFSQTTIQPFGFKELNQPVWLNPSSCQIENKNIFSIADSFSDV